MVIGRPYEIRFRESARKLFSELRFAPTERRANGSLDMEIDTSELAIATTLHSCAAHIVFLERSNVTKLEPYSASDAIQRLEKTICFGDEASRCEQLESLRYFARVPIWKLQYSGIDPAERTLIGLLDGASR